MNFFPQNRKRPLSSPLAGSMRGRKMLPGLIDRALTALRRPTGRPLPAGRPVDVMNRVQSCLGPAEIPADGMGDDAALDLLSGLVRRYGIDLSHPKAAAHLQPPPLAVGVAADMLASLTNASVDTYDSGPCSVAMERWLIHTLAHAAGLGERAAGVLTPGGSMSNLLGLMLARDSANARTGHRNENEAPKRKVVFCSKLAHFSIQRACAVLGLGEAAVIPVEVDDRRRMSLGDLRDKLANLGPHDEAIAVVATAGTTDFGSVDPLPEIGALCRERGLWFHVDAAYGFGAKWSQRLRTKLEGLAEADSITLDLHKLGWQPAACSVLMTRDADLFRSLHRTVAYLNPSDDAEEGFDGLLGQSLQTTRRGDAIKAIASFLALGERGLGARIDRCHDAARHGEKMVRRDPSLELVHPADLTTVVFRYRPESEQDEDELNGRLRRCLLERGQALIGRTTVSHDGAPVTCLKLTITNPDIGPAEVESLLDLVVATGRDLEAEPAIRRQRSAS
ncbi:MAG: pyridoxal-dependent decarboxylase [Myxococcota bacterium]